MKHIPVLATLVLAAASLVCAEEPLVYQEWGQGEENAAVETYWTEESPSWSKAYKLTTVSERDNASGETRYRHTLTEVSTGKETLLACGLGLTDTQWFKAAGRDVLLLLQMKDLPDAESPPGCTMDYYAIDPACGTVLLSTAELPGRGLQWRYSTRYLADGCLALGYEGTPYAKFSLMPAAEVLPFHEDVETGAGVPGEIQGWKLQRENNGGCNLLCAVKGCNRVLLYESARPIIVRRTIGDYWVCDDCGCAHGARSVFVVQVDSKTGLPFIVFLSQNADSPFSGICEFVDASLDGGSLRIRFRKDGEEHGFTIPAGTAANPPYVYRDGRTLMESCRRGGPCWRECLPGGYSIATVSVGSGIVTYPHLLCEKQADGSSRLIRAKYAPARGEKMPKELKMMQKEDFLPEAVAVSVSEYCVQFYAADGQLVGGYKFTQDDRALFPSIGARYGEVGVQEIYVRRQEPTAREAADGVGVRYFICGADGPEIRFLREEDKQMLEKRWARHRDGKGIPLRGMMYETIETSGVPVLHPDSWCASMEEDPGLPAGPPFTQLRKVILWKILPLKSYGDFER